jgi:hypothetical protein
MLEDMSLEGANYVQDFLELFLKIEQYFIHRLKNGMET